MRLKAESLGEGTCESISKGLIRNLECIHLTHLREEEEVQVSDLCAAVMTSLWAG
jgi:hypothetical protein